MTKILKIANLIVMVLVVVLSIVEISNYTKCNSIQTQIESGWNESEDRNYTITELMDLSTERNELKQTIYNHSLLYSIIFLCSGSIVIATICVEFFLINKQKQREMSKSNLNKFR